MIFRKIKYGSNDYLEECRLRNEVLRVPLGMNLYKEDLQQEKDQMHFGLFDEAENLVACAVAVRISYDQAKIRQMAVHQFFRGRGLGRRILEEIERELFRRGFTKFLIHARITAAEFYMKSGYDFLGEEFLEIGIPHIRMVKMLSSAKG